MLTDRSGISIANSETGHNGVGAGRKTVPSGIRSHPAIGGVLGASQRVEEFEQATEKRKDVE